MNSLGSSSKWPSYDSLRSNSSFFPSESEQTEDEADVFSDMEGDNGMTKSLSVSEGIIRPGDYLEFAARTDHSRSKGKQPEQCTHEVKHPGSATSPGAAMLASSSATPGDLVFAQKCADLRRFTHPLLELLHGLKTGRFDKGLSSFQQSVAIDRLQRILGVLQRPEMGEKYLQTLLQIEIMLKIWFPQVTFQSTNPAVQTTTTPTLPLHSRQNQLHMPVKKRKLSWSDPDHSGKVPAKQHQHGKDGSHEASTVLGTVSPCLPGSPKKTKAPADGDALELAWAGRAAAHEFTDHTGASRKLPRLCGRRENQSRRPTEIPAPSPCGSPATQDSLVSSSNTLITTDSP